MTKKRISFVAAVLSGILIWAIPYFLGMGEGIDHFIYYLSASFIISAVLGYLNEDKISLWPTGILLGQYIYVITGMFINPDSASLWPIAIFVITLYTLAPSFAGAYLGHYARK